MADFSGGIRILRYGELGSTNEQAKTLIEAGVSERLVISSDHQTDARGRNGRQWQSLRGNLSCSIVVCPRVPPARLSDLSFVAAVAVQRCIKKLIPSQSVKIKWPNDILVEGAKISGILLEVAHAVGSKHPSVIVGIGVNIALAPDNLKYRAICLRDLDCEVSDDAFFFNLIDQFLQLENKWLLYGLGSILAEWLDHAFGLGEKILVRTGERELEGVFENLDERGALLLRGADGKVDKISAGDIFLR